MSDNNPEQKVKSLRSREILDDEYLIEDSYFKEFNSLLKNTITDQQQRRSVIRQCAKMGIKNPEDFNQNFDILNDGINYCVVSSKEAQPITQDERNEVNAYYEKQKREQLIADEIQQDLQNTLNSQKLEEQQLKKQQVEQKKVQQGKQTNQPQIVPNSESSFEHFAIKKKPDNPNDQSIITVDSGENSLLKLQQQTNANLLQSNPVIEPNKVQQDQNAKLLLETLSLNKVESFLENDQQKKLKKQNQASKNNKKVENNDQEKKGNEEEDNKSSEESEDEIPSPTEKDLDNIFSQYVEKAKQIKSQLKNNKKPFSIEQNEVKEGEEAGSKKSKKLKIADSQSETSNEIPHLSSKISSSIQNKQSEQLKSCFNPSNNSNPNTDKNQFSESLKSSLIQQYAQSNQNKIMNLGIDETQTNLSKSEKVQLVNYINSCIDNESWVIVKKNDAVVQVGFPIDSVNKQQQNKLQELFLQLNQNQ